MMNAGITITFSQCYVDSVYSIIAPKNTSPNCTKQKHRLTFGSRLEPRLQKDSIYDYYISNSEELTYPPVPEIKRCYNILLSGHHNPPPPAFRSMEHCFLHFPYILLVPATKQKLTKINSKSRGAKNQCKNKKQKFKLTTNSLDTIQFDTNKIEFYRY